LNNPCEVFAFSIFSFLLCGGPCYNGVTRSCWQGHTWLVVMWATS